MKLTHILPLLALAAIGTVTVRAQDMLEAEADKPAPIKSAPTSRLGAELSKDLTRSQRAIAERASQLDMKEQMLEAARARTEAQAETSLETKRAIAKTASDEASDDDEAITNLVKVYQSMNPKKAAVIFEQLDLSIQVAVASKMRNQATAKILAAMHPDAASRLTTALVQPSKIALIKAQLKAANKIPPAADSKN